MTTSILQDYDYDIVLINLPWSDLTVPFLAPAILKGIAESHGYKAKTIDFNVDLLEKICDNDREKYIQLQEYYSLFNINSSPLLNDFYDHIIKTLKKINFKYLGISVFYILTQKATIELCKKLRKEMPNVQIVLGGKGLNVHSHLSVHPYLSEEEKTFRFDKLMAEKNLADYFIIGDAEDAIIDLLSGKLDSTIPTDWYVPIKDNLEYPFANFDDYKLEKYNLMPGQKKRLQLPIISSKGCVRRCDFCDVPSQFKKFQSKDGKRMAEEMLFLAKKYDNYEFTMADSIANGNLKSLKEFSEIIAEYNHTADNNKKIKWNSNWIHRPIGQLSEDVFKKIADSGATHFTVGAEHFSDTVLEAMNKKTNIAGLFYELNLFKKYNVQCEINNIVAHWSETYESFIEHVDNFIKLGPYISSDIITNIRFNLFYIMKNTPAVEDHKNDIVMLQDNFSLSWYTKKNPTLTIKPRLARYYFLITLSKHLNYPINDKWKSTTLQNHIHRIKEILPEAMKLFKKHIDKKTFKECNIFKMLENIEEYADKKIEEFFPNTELKLKLTANSCKGDPEFYIKINDKIEFKKEINSRFEITLPIKYDYKKNVRIEIGMSNKNKFDTIVDKNGNILQDKNIILEKIEIDGIDILKYPDFFNTKATFIVNNKETTPQYGFWSNASTIIEFPAPFWKYFQKEKNSNSYLLDKEKEKFNETLEKFKNLFTEIEY